MCLLAEKWVSDVAGASFRRDDSASPRPPCSLEAWFDQPKVRAHVRARNAGPGPLALLGAAIKGAGNFLGSLLPVEVGKEEKTELKEVGAFAEESGGAEAATAAPAHTEPATTSPSTLVEPAAPSIRKPPALASVPAAAVQQQTQAVEDVAKDDEEAEEQEGIPAPLRLHLDSSAPIITPLSGEDGWMARAYEPRRLRWGRLLATGAVFAVSPPPLFPSISLLKPYRMYWMLKHISFLSVSEYSKSILRN
jgi:Na+-transporting methylmalonyl-CoA/oxaloacetate decarboxylase gamma subunit